MSAVLQFRDYHILESHYKFNPYFQEFDEEVKLTPQISYKLETNPQTFEEAIIYLGIEIGDEDLRDFNFYAKAKVSGFFLMHPNEEMSEEEILSFYKYNAVAILFPYLRSIISDITSKGSETPIILPTMNIVKMIEENEFKEVKNDF
ncbi:protein-export chaperone SecB [Ureibacillus chungkukjangi]|uniref:protein-export chaperone SecB n=1 Tax=Ureibacillus chungkukjangi TaxID=1202712 RepID=UPI00384E6B2F